MDKSSKHPSQAPDRELREVLADNLEALIRYAHFAPPEEAVAIASRLLSDSDDAWERAVGDLCDLLYNKVQPLPQTASSIAGPTRTAMAPFNAPENFTQVLFSRHKPQHARASKARNASPSTLPATRRASKALNARFEHPRGCACGAALGYARRMSDDGLEAVIEKLRSALEVRPEVLEGYLFGSLAKGTAAAHSDVDVAVFIEPSALSSSPFGYDAVLGSELQRALGRPDVDVVVLNTAGPVLYHRVLRDGVRLVSRDLRSTTTREGLALSRYCDFVPTLREVDRIHRARIAAGGVGR